MEQINFVGVEPTTLINEIANTVKNQLFAELEKTLKDKEQNNYLSADAVCKNLKIKTQCSKSQQMEIPFYYSFKDFTDNYETDLQNWLKDYPDGTETDFFIEARELYNQCVWHNEIEATVIYVEYPESLFIDINEYANILTEKLRIHLSYLGLYDNVDYRNAPNASEIDGFDYYEDCNERTKNNTVLFNKIQHGILKPFFIYDYDFIMDSPIFLPKTKDYKNFGFAIRRIVNFIDEKLNLKTNEGQTK